MEENQIILTNENSEDNEFNTLQREIHKYRDEIQELKGQISILEARVQSLEYNSVESDTLDDEE